MKREIKSPPIKGTVSKEAVKDAVTILKSRYKVRTIALVSGASGYLGSVLVGKLLEHGYSVIAVDNLMYGQTSLFQYCTNPDFTFYKGDIRDSQFITYLKECDIYIPLAAIVGAPACKNNQDAVIINTAPGWHRQYFLNNPLVIFPTTNSGYGASTGEVYCTEETPLHPISDYGKHKATAEGHLLEYPNTISLRLATVFGPSPRMRMDLLVNDLAHQAVFNRSIVLYEPKFMRNYLHIEDFSDCVIHCINNADKMKGQVYNLGLFDGNYSKLELAQKIKDYTDCEIFIGAGSDPDKRNYIVSNDKLGATGFAASRSIELGIEQLIKLYGMLPRGAFRNV